VLAFLLRMHAPLWHARTHACTANQQRHAQQTSPRRHWRASSVGTHPCPSAPLVPPLCMPHADLERRPLATIRWLGGGLQYEAVHSTMMPCIMRSLAVCCAALREHPQFQYWKTPVGCAARGDRDGTKHHGCAQPHNQATTMSLDGCLCTQRALKVEQRPRAVQQTACGPRAQRTPGVEQRPRAVQQTACGPGADDGALPHAAPPRRKPSWRWCRRCWTCPRMTPRRRRP